MSFAPWLRFPDDDAMQYRLRYALDREFHQQEVDRTQARRRQRPDWSLQYYLRQVFRAQSQSGAFVTPLGFPSLQAQALEERLGYSLHALRQHIEGLMTNGMTWQQYLDAEVVIDHVKPICRFDMTDGEQFLKWLVAVQSPAVDGQSQSRQVADKI